MDPTDEVLGETIDGFLCLTVVNISETIVDEGFIKGSSVRTRRRWRLCGSKRMFIYRVSPLCLQYLLHYVLSVKSLLNRHAWSRTPVAETSWALLRDCYHGAMCIRHRPQHIAIATLYLALNSYGVELPVGEKEWWQV